MEQQNQPIWQKYMPEYVNLYYVNRDEDLNTHQATLQECVSKNHLYPLNDVVYDFWVYPEGEYLNEIEEKMDADGLHEEFVENEDEIKDWIYDHDESNPVDELLEHTSDQTFFYSLGIELDHGLHYGYMATPWRNQSCAQSAYRIRRALGIKKGSPEAAEILELCENSTYGGELRIYFESDIRDMISGDEWNYNEDKEGWRAIHFKGTFAVAVWDNTNGAGDYVKIHIDKELPFIRENLQISEVAEKYNIEYACGLCGDWLRDCDKPTFSCTRPKTNGAKKSKAVTQEQYFQRLYEQGKCSPLDNNISRHRDVYYRNEVPCANVCPHCGKEWLD